MTSGTGRRERIVIGCVTFETVQVSDPVKYYDATIVHLIHYVKDKSDPRGKIYQEFYDRVCELIKKECRMEPEIVEHNDEPVFDFTSMLRSLLKILRDSDPENNDVYVNISAGTSEYVAAAAIASMMIPGTIPFSIRSKEYMVSDERSREVYFDENSRPVGLIKSTYGVGQPLPYYRIDIPDERLVRGLRLLNERNVSKMSVKAPEMIRAMVEKDIWYRELDFESYKKPEGTVRIDSEQKRTEAVYYQRDFVDKWLKNGWVKKDELSKRYLLTESGKKIIDTFYV